MSDRLTVGIAYNLKKGISAGPPDAQAEYDDPDTIQAIKSALESAGCRVELYEAEEDFPAQIAARRPDIVFNVAEGRRGRGREAHVPAILSFLGVPYVGSDEAAMCLALDKALTKRLLSTWGIRTPKFAVFRKGSPLSADDIASVGDCLGSGAVGWPVIVKPNEEGSGKGITDVSVVPDATALREAVEEMIRVYEQDALVEEYIPGREFTVGLLGNGAGTKVFAPMEVLFNDKGRSVYSYEVKRDFKRHVSYACPPDISAGLRAEMEGAARLAYDALGCRDFARADFRLSPGGSLYFIEINPLPGLAPGYSDYPMLAGFCGVGYNSLIEGVLKCALARYGMDV
ncbi:MAG: ATP-grasp domain-containing protein [Clostridiales bacterium]|nr:ATP-grasp domain-containing protein [Clostridiales bacterium]